MFLQMILVAAVAASEPAPQPAPQPTVTGFYCTSPFDKKHVTRRLNIALKTAVWQDETGLWYAITDIAPAELTLADDKNENGRRVLKLNRNTLELTEFTLLFTTNQQILLSYECHTGVAINMIADRKF